MKRLYEIDLKDYDENAERTYRSSTCGIVIREKKIAMCYVDKRGAYIIPGGGIEEGETMEQAVIREMREETGLRIIPESVREYGSIHVVRKGIYEPVYDLESYYFVCQAEEELDEVHLTQSEVEKGYHFGFADPFEILQMNSDRVSAGETPCLFERERVLLLRLISDGMFQ